MYNEVMLKQVHANEQGACSVVELNDGTKIDADVVILGTGVRPATQFLKRDSGIELDRMGGIVCDPYLQTSVKDVFAAGDIASYP